MNLKKPRGSQNLTKDAGFTLVEVLVSLTIMAMMSMVIWTTFATGLKTIRKIPESTKDNLNIIKLDYTFRSQLNKVVFPYWLSEYETSDDDYIELPYYEGYEDYQLFLYTEQDSYSDEKFLIIETNNEEMDTDLAEILELTPFKIELGPFSEIYFDYATDDDDFLTGIDVTVIPMNPNYGTVTIFGKLGGTPFWLED